MSAEYPPNTEEAIGHRVASFIETHMEDGLWWVFNDPRTSRQPTLPFQRVEFQSDTTPWLQEATPGGSFDAEDNEGILYRMDVYFSVPDSELQVDKEGYKEPGRISVIVTKDTYDVEIIDRYARLAVIEEGLYDDDNQQRRLQAVETLMGELKDLQSNKLFLSLRQRSFPL